jgi:tetratricopeptide (TPR) repeat protein
MFLEERTSEFGEAAARLARHWLHAGDYDNAARHFERAAEEAEHTWAKERAVALYKEALEIAPSEEQKRSLRRRLAVAQQAYIHLEDARALKLGPTMP